MVPHGMAEQGRGVLAELGGLLPWRRRSPCAGYSGGRSGSTGMAVLAAACLALLLSRAQAA